MVANQCHYFIGDQEKMCMDPILNEVLEAGPKPARETSEKFVEQMEEQIRLYRRTCATQSTYLWKQAKAENRIYNMLSLAETRIRVDPGRPDGYIQKAMSLTRMGKWDEAEEAFEEAKKAIAKCAYDVENQELYLRGIYVQEEIMNAARLGRTEGDIPQIRKLEETEMGEEPSLDPMGLPDPVVRTILGYLDTKTLSRSMEVSHRWEAGVLRSSNFLRVPKLRDNIGVRQISAFCSTCKKVGLTHCHQLHLRSFPGCQQGILHVLVKAGLKVDDLSINLEYESGLDALLATSSPLRDFFSIPKKLSLTLGTVVDVSSLNRILGHLTQLRCLSLDIMAKVPGITYEMEDGEPNVFPRLRELELVGTTNVDDSLEGLTRGILLGNKFPVLSKFKTTWCCGSFENFRPVFTPTLKFLCLFSGSRYDHLSDLMWELKRGEVTLEELDLTESFWGGSLTEEALSPLAELRVFSTKDVSLQRPEVLQIVKATNGNLEHFDYMAYGSDFVNVFGDKEEAEYLNTIIGCCPKLKYLSVDFRDDQEDCHRSFQLLRNALEKFPASQTLEEFINRHDELDDEGLRILLGEKGSLPSLRKIHNINLGYVSKEFIKELEDEWGVAVPGRIVVCFIY